MRTSIITEEFDVEHALILIMFRRYEIDRLLSSRVGCTVRLVSVMVKRTCTLGYATIFNIM